MGNTQRQRKKRRKKLEEEIKNFKETAMNLYPCLIQQLQVWSCYHRNEQLNNEY